MHQIRAELYASHVDRAAIGGWCTDQWFSAGRPGLHRWCNSVFLLGRAVGADPLGNLVAVPDPHAAGGDERDWRREARPVGDLGGAGARYTAEHLGDVG